MASNICQALPCGSETQDPAQTMASLVLSLTRSLQQPALSREAAISAGVTLAAAAGAGAGAHTHALVLANAFFPAPGDDANSWLTQSGLPPAPIDAVILGPTSGTSLAAEAAKFTPFGRLSAIRGLLTAASPAALAARLTPPAGIPTESYDGAASEENREEGWGLLLDGALPEICGAMENPVDAHFKFHAAAALRSALTRAKAIKEKDAVASAMGAAGGAAMDVEVSEDAEVEEVRGGSKDVTLPRPEEELTLSDALSSRVLSILWANWEDPLSQTVKEIQGAFEQLLDLKSGGQENAITSGEGPNPFLLAAAGQLLDKGAHCKGRYVPLAVIVPRLGAGALLALRPDLLVGFNRVNGFLRSTDECLLRPQPRLWSSSDVSTSSDMWRS
jgi:hypothetical protein